MQCVVKVASAHLLLASGMGVAICNISPPRLASLVMESHCYEWVTTIGVKIKEKTTRGLGGNERTMSIEQWEGRRSEVS